MVKKLQQFLADVKFEMSKVSWPTWDELRSSTYIVLGLSLILGGALGNLYDRVILGYVIDFLYFHIQDYYWPAFNIADTSICLGAGILIYTQFVKK